MLKTQKKRNRITALAVCLLMIASLIIPANTQEASAAAAPGNPRWAADGSGTITWDCVSFGHYPQGKYNPVNKPEEPIEDEVYTDADGTKFMYQTDVITYGDQYYKIEPIQWRVLQVSGGEALLLSDKLLEADIEYHGDLSADISWENSDIRSWMNGYNEDEPGLINMAFTKEEQNQILEKTIPNPGDPEQGIPDGNATRDKLFLLSMEEAMNPEYGFLKAQGQSNTREGLNTAYTANKNYDEEGDPSLWWLRSPGRYGDVTAVDFDGGISPYALAFSNESVRPALYLNLNSNVWKYKGTVQSKGHVSKEPEKPTAAAPLKNPRVENNGKVTWDCVYFGSYLQGYDGKGQFRKDPVKWRVLAVDGKEALLLADRNLEGMITYNDYTYPEGVVASAQESFKKKQAAVYGGTPPAPSTWERCTLRSWLNGYGSSSNDEGKDYSADNLLDKLFVEKEQQAILKKEIKNADNPIYKVPGGKNTQDKLFLLSIDEMTNPEYGFSTAIEAASPGRQANNTAFVAAQDRYNSEENKPQEWWLRSPGIENYCASSVMEDGYIAGSWYTVAETVVRPALYLDLTSDLWKNAGTVSSKGTIEKASQTITAKSVTKACGSKPFKINAKAKGKLTYKSGDTKVASVSTNGTVTIKGPGKATITITAAETSAYKAATKKITITVNPKRAAIAKVSSPKAGTLKATWKKDTKASGYQVVIAQNSKFTKGKKTATVTKNKTVSKTFKKLQKKKTYYVKVRAYKTSGKTKLYGAYSSVKKVKVK